MADKRISDFPTLTDAKDDDLILVSSSEDTYNMKVATLKAAASKVAAQAVETAEDALEQTGTLRAELMGVQDDIMGKVDGAFVEDGYLYLTSGDEVAAGPLGPFSGSGGGGGTASGYLLSLKNLLPSRNLTVSGEGAAMLRFTYTSADEQGEDDGPGVGTVTVGGAKKATLSITQGENELDIAPYLGAGANTVKLKVENSEGSSRTLSYTVTVVALNVSTTFDTLEVYTGAVTFSYTVTGSGAKTVHFEMDSTELGSEEVLSSGRSRSYALPAQTEGAHRLTVWAEVTEDGVSVRSNTLQIGMLWVSPTMSAPAVLSNFAQTEAKQGEILTIPYIAYDPQAESAAVALEILEAGGSVYRSQSLTVDRTPQSWTVQDYPAGSVTFRIACGSASFSQTVQVSESTETVEPITDALTLCFDPSGRSNNEENPAQWTDGSTTASFTGVCFSAADGWLTDSAGASVLRLLPGGEMRLPYKVFGSDARTAGLTVELEMATHNVRDYDTVVLSCVNGGRGLRVASQFAELRSEQSAVSMQFKEDERVRVSFVVEPRNLHRLICVYVNGVLCGALQYPENDDFSQNPAEGITIGAVSSGIDIYRLRVYTKGLTRQDILDNFIADQPLLSQRLELSRANDIFDLAENITISKLPPTLPWEFRNNTSPRVLFKSADFSGSAWQDDIEARYPEDSTDCTNLAALCAWVASTDRSAVDTEEEKAARLEKFKSEFEEHFVKAPMLYYYLFTEVFLMVDSRAKNFFPTTFDGTHWLPFPYDFDTALGINNEGQLVFDYDLEDTDHLDGANIFNGQESVLWCNVRDAFGDEIRTMYNTLRSGGVFGFETVKERFEEHQAVWPEAVWNEDAWEKYLEPLEHDNDGSYLAMLQGSKASQRAWWLFNGMRYRDSKYRCGDAQRKPER